MKTIHFYQVDVFSASRTHPFTGNPIAVLFDTEGLKQLLCQTYQRRAMQCEFSRPAASCLLPAIRH
jgi:predicted PhzF superfamily epimerase YddE/YHI9